MQAYTIGQLARAAGVPTSTVRFYERAKLLKPDFRTGSNYRGYTERALERLRFIRAVQASGFSLSDVSDLLDLAYGDGPPCDDVLAVARNRLEEVRRRISELRRVEKTLLRAVDACCQSEEPDLCQRVSRLRGEEMTCSSNAPQASCGPGARCEGKASSSGPRKKRARA